MLPKEDRRDNTLLTGTLLWNCARIVSRNSKTIKSLEIITFQGIWSFLLFLDAFEYGMCLKTGEETIPLEIMTFDGILLFYCFQTLS